MSAPLRGALRSLQVVNKNVALQKASIVSGPPRYKVSMAEKAGLGLVMVTAVCAPAAYILTKIQCYRAMSGGD